MKTAWAGDFMVQYPCKRLAVEVQVFNQKFSVTALYGDNVNVSTDDVRTWIKDCLEGKVKNYLLGVKVSWPHSIYF